MRNAVIAFPASKSLKSNRQILVLLSFMLCIFSFHTEAIGQCYSWKNVGTAGFTPAAVTDKDIAADGSGTPYIIFRDSSAANKASVMRYNGTSWEYVGGAGISTGSADNMQIGINSSGTIYISYSESGGVVKKFNGTTWENVGTPGIIGKLGFGSDGLPRIGARGSAKRFDGTTWVSLGSGFPTGIDEDFDIAMAIDTGDNLFVAYSDLATDPSTGLMRPMPRVMRFNGSSWDTSFISTIYSDVLLSMASAPDGKVYLLYSRNHTLEMFTYSGGIWSHSDSYFGLGAAYFPDLAVDAASDPWVTYNDFFAGGRTTVQKKSGGSWLVQGVRGFSAGNTNEPKITIDATGTAHVCFRDYVNSEKLTYMKLTAGILGISGNLDVCQGSTSTLTNPVNSGTWSSSNTAVATIGSSSGIVTGVAAGTSVISYVIGSCSTTATVTINGAAGSITGGSAGCAGSTLSLANAAGGGTWSSSNTTVATIGTSGLVSCIMVGTTMISYTVGACRATKLVSVEATISAPYIAQLAFDSSSIVVAFAGNGFAGYGGDGGVATSSVVKGPSALCRDTMGNIYISDYGNNRIRKVNATTGIITTIAGTGVAGYSGDGGAATAAKINGPFQMFIDNAGNIVFADRLNHRIRMISTAGIISTIAGTGTPGFSGDGGPATAANFNNPNGLAKDVSGNIYVTDLLNQRIRKISASGTITTISGDGTTGFTGDGSAATGAKLNYPNYLYVDESGNLLFSDNGNGRIRMINPAGIISTVWSGLNSPYGLTKDPTGSLYVACYGSYNVRKMNISGATSVTVNNGSFGYSGNGGPAVNARFTHPADLILNKNGDLLVADIDMFNNASAVRSVKTNNKFVEGVANLCIGYNMTMDRSVTGGTWTSSNTSVATINSAGVVTGVSAGSTVISYQVSNSCNTATATLTINVSAALSPGAITGTASACAGATVTLTNPTAGTAGTWSSSNTSVVAADTSGIMTAVDAGAATVTYSITYACGSAFATFPFSVTAASSAIITTIAGDGTSGYSGDGGPSTAATLTSPKGITTDVAGNIYISDHTRVRKISTTGIITTYAGGGSAGDSGPATAANISVPNDVKMDRYDNLFITGNSSAIRKVNPAGIMSRVAGSGVFGWEGDGGPATAANLSEGFGVVVDSSGNVYFSNPAFVVVRKVNITGIISRFAGRISDWGPSGDGGSATNARLDYPRSIAIDRNNKFLYIADANKIRRVNLSTGVITHFAGGASDLGGTFTGDGGAASAASFIQPEGMAFDSYGNMYVADYGHHRIRKIDTFGIITTVAGTGIAGFSGDGIAAVATRLNQPYGVAVGPDNTVYFSEYGGKRIRKITWAVQPITGTATLCAGSVSSLANVTTGGTWSSSNTAIATVGSTGLVTGISAGTCVISYSKSNTCGVAVATRIVTVTLSSGSGSISGTAAVCVGATTNLIAPVGSEGGTWSTGSATIATIGSSTGTVTGVAAGTSTITYTVTNSCGVSTIFAVVTVNIFPDAGSVTGGTVICPATSATLTASIAGGTWSSSNTSVATIGTSGTVTGVSPGTSLISYSVMNACGTSVATHTVTVNSSATAGTLSGAISICTMVPSGLSSTVSGGTWSSSNTAVATIGSTGIVSGLTIGTSEISYIVTNSCGTAGTAVIVTVNLSPDAGTITGTTTLCTGGVTTLSNATPDGVWSSTNTSIAIVGTSGIVTGVGAGTATISYTVTNSCGSVAATTVVTVNATLTGVADITGATAICAGTTTTLANATADGVWSSSNTSGATVDGSGVVTGIASGTTVISYTITNTCGSLSATHTLTVNAAPLVTGALSMCSGQTSSLSASPSGGTWNSSNTAVATVHASSGLLTGVGAGTAEISYTPATGCIAKVIVTVGTAPASIIGTMSACQGATSDLDHTDAGGAWSSSNTARATINSSTGVVTAVSAGTATITYAVSAGCYRAATFTIFNNPGAIGGTAALCEGAATTLSCSPGGGTWSSTNTSVATISTTGGVSSVSAGTTTISYVTGTGCAATKVVTVNTLPDAITGTTMVCVGGTTTLGSAPGGGTWTSYFTSRASVNAATGVVTGMSAGTSIISYSLAGGCRRTTIVTVAAAPATITGSLSLCVGSTTDLNCGTTGGTWSAVTSAVATINSSTGLVSGIGTGTSVISYVTSSGCARTAVVTVSISGSTITGDAVVCVGQTNATLSSGMTGGTWASSNTAIATVHAASGLLTGIGAGNANITYTRTPGCYNIIEATVNAAVGTITGAASVAAGATTTLTSSTGGGTWSSTNTLKATVNPTTGEVTGVTVGTTTISYLVSTGCYRARTMVITATRPGISSEADAALTVLKVYPNPTAGKITIEAPVSGTFTVYTIEGRQVVHYPVSTAATTVSLPQNIATGVYLCRFSGEDGSTAMVRMVYQQ